MDHCHCVLREVVLEVAGEQGESAGTGKGASLSSWKTKQALTPFLPEPALPDAQGSPLCVECHSHRAGQLHTEPFPAPAAGPDVSLCP